MKRYFIITYGCQMNKSDSERIAAVLEKSGYKPDRTERRADLVVLVACSVRQTAMDRIYGKAMALAKLKIKNKKLKTVLTGCVLKKDREKLKDKFDLILDIKEWRKILNSKFQIPKSNPKPRRVRGCPAPYVVLGKIQNPERALDIDYFHIQPRYTEKFRAYVPIMTGCNNFCSYCAVPYVRGREASRDVADVLREARALAKNGCLEITLLGQNVNAYRPDDVESFSRANPYVIARSKATKQSHKRRDCHARPMASLAMTAESPFAALLWEVNQIPGVERIHFTAPHPKDMAREVIDALALSKMVNYLHLPVQAGDDEVLQRMNRGYTADDYLKLVAKIRKKKPGIALGTDIIVGFPGETKKAFENTIKLYKKVGFDIAYHAMYSPRPGTVAAKLKDDVPRIEKKRRWNVLQNLMEKIVLEKNQKYVGKTVSVLVDKYKDGKCIGNSQEMKMVRFPGKKNMVGKIFDVKIKKAYEWILEGDAK